MTKMELIEKLKNVMDMVSRCHCPDNADVVVSGRTEQCDSFAYVDGNDKEGNPVKKLYLFNSKPKDGKICLSKKPWHVEECFELDVLFIKDAGGRCLCELPYGSGKDDISREEAYQVAKLIVLASENGIDAG